MGRKGVLNLMRLSLLGTARCLKKGNFGRNLWDQDAVRVSVLSWPRKKVAGQ